MDDVGSARSSSGPTERQFPAMDLRAAARWAALWCLPYLILGLVYAFTNPPGAAPDEQDHLIKAVAAGRFDNGVPYAGPVGDEPWMIRNASIARTYLIPERLNPARDYDCFAFQPDVTADCLPGQAGYGDDLVEATATIGAYPIFLYIPIGLAANLASDVEQAFLFARLVGLAMSLGLLFLGIWHISRWLGRWAAIGTALAVTPMALFSASNVTTSGVEIMGSVAVACATVVVTRHPESLAAPSTLAVIAVTGSMLVMSRQLGIVTFGLLSLIALSRGGWPVVWLELRRGSVALLSAAGVLLCSAIALIVWELKFDNPALTGTPWSVEAFHSWVMDVWFRLESAVGKLGWLDTALPRWAILAWVAAAAVVGGTALFTARRADVVTLVAAASALVGVSYFTYSVVFFPVANGLQGRHLLGLFAILPSLAAVAVAEWAAERGRRRGVVVVQAATLGILLPLIHGIAIYANSRRYSVGASGPVWFPPDAVWAPAGGWVVWLAVAAVGVVLMVAMQVRSGRAAEGLPAADLPR